MDDESGNVRLLRWGRLGVFPSVALGLWLILAAIVCLNGFGTFNTDIKPEIYIAPWETLTRSVLAWTSSPYLGSANFNVGLTPLLIPLVPLRFIGISPEWTFKLFHLALWTLAAMGCMRFTRRLAPSLSRWGGLIAAVVYLANPYTVSAGATLAIALPLALLPWMLLALLRGFEEPRTWMWPAACAGAFFAMTGMNAGIVPVMQLLAVVPVTLAVRSVQGTAWRDIARVIGRCALLVVGVSLYWLVPTISAARTGAQIVASSETIEGIAKVSSFTEVLRGVGLWPLYGSSDTGAWVPQHAVYVAVPWIVAVTMLWPAIAFVSARWTSPLPRRFAAFSVAIAAVVMVGAFPGTAPAVSPFAAALQRAFENPLLAAFRTTNKIGAVMVLGFAVLIAHGVVQVLPKLWQFVPARLLLVLSTIMVLVAWTFPAVGGRLYISALDIPAYWQQAADKMNERSHDTSVLVLPGQVRPDYRWSVERPDDILNSLLTRRAVVPDSTPNASAGGVNFLSALDAAVQNGTSATDTVSTMARYLGAGDVLLRNDMVWESDGGARPAQTAALLSRDSGLYGVSNFGKPGENTIANSTSYQYGEQILPPLQWYQVQRSGTTLRAQTLTGQLLVAGDGFSFPALTGAGLLSSTPVVRYAQDVTSGQWLNAMRGGGRMVLTDTNARRNAVTNRLTANEGFLLRADQKLGTTRTLGSNPDDQTVRLESGVRVSTTAAGGTFFDLPYANGNFAVDGNPATAWRFGDFGNAVGQKITIRFDSAVTLGDVPISQLRIGSHRIGQVRVSAGGQSRVVSLPRAGSAVAKLGGVTAKKLTVTVLSTRGAGYNMVGIAEIGIPKVADRVSSARLPLTFSDRYRKLDAEGRSVFARTPLDVLMTRVQNTSSTADDTETALDRTFELPDARTYKVRANVRMTEALDGVYDELQGRDPSIKVTSSGYYFNNPAWRASKAADGHRLTAWVPGGGTLNAWWQIQGPQRTIDSVRISQRLGNASTPKDSHHVTQVGIDVDGVRVATAPITVGTTTVRFPARQGSVVRVTLLATSGDRSTVPPRFTTIDAGFQSGAVTQAPGKVCLTVGEVDGVPLRMRPATSALAGFNDQGTPWVGCDELSLAAGEHTVTPSAGAVLDQLQLTDQVKPRAVSRSTPTVVSMSSGTVRSRLRVGATTQPFAIVTGQSLDTRWHAYAGGRSLGRPTMIDGYSTGWIVPAGRGRTIEISYEPQRWANLGSAGTVLTLLLMLLSIGLYRRRRRQGPAAPEASGGSRTQPRIWPRWIWEVLIALAAAFFVGPTGLAAALAAIGVSRWRQPPQLVLLGVAAAGLLAAIAVQLVVAGGSTGTVSADAVSASLVPHHLAGASLVLWCFAALLPDARSARTEDHA